MPPRVAFEPRFGRIASAIGDPTRARTLARMLDGRLHTAGELARHADVMPATISSHLKLLLHEGLIRTRAQGRHRYFGLADSTVAQALEALMHVAQNAAPQAQQWQRPAMRGLRHARSCFGHLAGELGVVLHSAMLRKRWVELTLESGTSYVLTPAGVSGLTQLGLPVEQLSIAAQGPSVAPRVLYACVDWSERRDHFAGKLADALLDFFIAEKWLRLLPNSRELVMTSKGARAWATLVASHEATTDPSETRPESSP